MIDTGRLTLRGWRAADARAHHALANHPDVVATLGHGPTPAQSRETVERQQAGLAAHGYCFWAAERRADGRVIGWCGLQPLPAAVGGGVEIGWTIAPPLWGRGYAREAATAVLTHAWKETTLAHVRAVTTPGNTRSRALMERLGLIRLPDGDFDHPALPPGDPLRRHLTYSIERPDAPV